MSREAERNWSHASAFPPVVPVHFRALDEQLAVLACHLVRRACRLTVTRKETTDHLLTAFAHRRPVLTRRDVAFQITSEDHLTAPLVRASEHRFHASVENVGSQLPPTHLVAAVLAAIHAQAPQDALQRPTDDIERLRQLLPL